MLPWLALTLSVVTELSPLRPSGLRPHAEAWLDASWQGIRGVTIGPIENTRHPDRGYGSAASARTLDEVKAMGGTWVSFTPFGRVNDLEPDGIDLTFEAPYPENRAAILAAMRQAKQRGLRVFLVPHLWVESQEWRALIDPKTDAGWARWAAAYRSFLLAWADVAREGGADMLSIGVELRSWATTRRVASLVAITREVRQRYDGLLTYSANWDDVADTLLWDEVDLIGVNAFFPLTEKTFATMPELVAGGRRALEPLGALARGVGKPVVLTEFGYTTRLDPALRPWEWPENIPDVVIDQKAQALAYAGLLAPTLDASWCAGFFMWRLYADPDDVSQEREFGFSPRGKLAELMLRDAFTAPHAVDEPSLWGDVLSRHRARVPGLYGWQPSPPLFEPTIAEPVP